MVVSDVHACVKDAFREARQAWRDAGGACQPDCAGGGSISNAKASSYFVFRLAKKLAEMCPGSEMKVQGFKDECISKEKTTGEWLLDIVIAEMGSAETPEKRVVGGQRSARYVRKIKWAVESEFSTSIASFAADFSKLLHIKADNYLYVHGLNQVDEGSLKAYMNMQMKLCRSLVSEAGITAPFYVAFVPTSGKSCKNISRWEDEVDEKLIVCENVSEGK